MAQYGFYVHLFKVKAVFYSSISLSDRPQEQCQYFHKNLLIDPEVSQMLRPWPRLMSAQALISSHLADPWKEPWESSVGVLGNASLWIQVEQEHKEWGWRGQDGATQGWQEQGRWNYNSWGCLVDASSASWSSSTTVPGQLCVLNWGAQQVPGHHCRNAIQSFLILIKNWLHQKYLCSTRISLIWKTFLCKSVHKSLRWFFLW